MQSKGYRHFAGLSGSKIKTVGKDTDIFNYTSLATAFSEAQQGDTILVEPGTYTLTSSLLLYGNITVKNMYPGIGEVIITSALTTYTVYCTKKAVGTTTDTINLVGLTITNSSTGTALGIDNAGGGTGSITVNCQNCNITNTSTGYAVFAAQTTNTIQQYINITGQYNSLGKSYFAQTLAGSVTSISRMICSGAFTLDTSAVAAIFNMLHCVYSSDAQTTGGGAGRLLNHVGNIYAASGLGAAVTKGASTDFDATGTLAAILYA